jgi:hypothetical protein
MNPNDEIRDAILRHLYEVHAKAPSPPKAAIKITELQKAMRAQGIKRDQVGGNLDYLLDTGYAVAVVENRTFQTSAGTTQNSASRTYKISHTGVDLIERASLFQQQPTGQQINVTNVGGVTVVGDHNVVSTRYADLSQSLSDLRQQILDTNAITETEKLNAVADIDTIRSQLQKPEPDASLIKRAWQGVEAAATTAGAIDAVTKIATLVGHIT